MNSSAAAPQTPGNRRTPCGENRISQCVVPHPVTKMLLLTERLCFSPLRWAKQDGALGGVCHRLSGTGLGRQGGRARHQLQRFCNGPTEIRGRTRKTPARVFNNLHPGDPPAKYCQVPFSAPHFKWVSCFALDPIYLARLGFGPYVPRGRLLGRSSHVNKGL